MARRLAVRDPVPSDIEIAQSLEPVPISQIAEAIGLQPSDYITYGPTKAKVCGLRRLAARVGRVQRIAAAISTSLIRQSGMADGFAKVTWCSRSMCDR